MGARGVTVEASHPLGPPRISTASTGSTGPPGPAGQAGPRLFRKTKRAEALAEVAPAAATVASHAFPRDSTEPRLTVKGAIIDACGKLIVSEYTDLRHRFANEPPLASHPLPSTPGVKVEEQDKLEGLRWWKDERGQGWIAEAKKKASWFSVKRWSSWRLSFLLAKLQHDVWEAGRCGPSVLPAPRASSSTSGSSKTGSKQGIRKLEEFAVSVAKAASPRKMKRLRRLGSAELPGHGKASSAPEVAKDEAFRNLFGNIVRVPAPSRCGSKNLESEWRPWRELEPSDVEHLSSDEVSHYEKLLHLSTKRPREERLARLGQLAQRNTLPLQLSGGDCSGTEPSSLAAFLALPAALQEDVTSTELKRLERLAFLADNEFLSMSERRDRLLELIRLKSKKSKGEEVRSVRSFVELLKRGSSTDVDIADSPAPEARFVVGQQVQRRDDGEEWDTGYVISVAPLKITVRNRNTPEDAGHVWDEVRHIPVEG